MSNTLASPSEFNPTPLLPYEDLNTALTALAAQKELLETLLTVGPTTAAGLHAILKKVLEISVRLTGADTGSLFLLNDEGEIQDSLLIRSGAPDEQRTELVRGAMTKGLAGWIMHHRQTGLITDTLTDERWTTLPDQPYTVRSALGVPILRHDVPLGLLTLIHAQPGHFTPEHSHLMQVTALQIALVLDNARLYVGLRQELDSRKRAQEALRRAHEKLELQMQEHTSLQAPTQRELNFLRQEVIELKTTITAFTAQKELLESLLALDPSTNQTLRNVLRKALEISVRLTGADTGSLFLLNDEAEIQDSLIIRTVATEHQQDELVRGAMTKGLAGWVLRNRQAGLISDTVTDERWTTLPDQPYSVRSALGVPILRHNIPLGLLTLIHAQPGHFSPEHSHLMQVTALQIALVLDNARLYVDLRQELDSRKRAQEALRRAHEKLELQIYERPATTAAQQDELTFLRQEVLELKTTLTAFTAQKELLEVLLAVAPTTSETLKTMLHKVLEIALRLTEAESGSLFLLNEMGIIQDSILIRGSTATSQQSELIRGVMEKGLAGWVIRHRQVGLILDTTADERWTTLPNQPYHVRSALGVPIIREKTVVGLLTLIHAQPRHFTSEHSHLMQVTALQIALVLDNARLYTDLQQELARRKQAELALRTTNDELEQRVQNRTAELAQAYEQVRAGRERLQVLSQQLISAQETERRRIARELHDEMGQTLSALKIDLQGVQRSPEATAVANRLEDSVAIVEQVLAQVRALSLDLRPSLLDDMGLEVALRWYLKRQAERTGWAVDLSADLKDERLPTDIETVCFRLAQEALTNIARHAQATRVDIHLKQNDTDLELLIHDNGVGFDVAAARERATRGASLGLLGMQERAMLAGGQVEITSQAGGGTDIVARFPLMADNVPDQGAFRP